MLTLYRQGQPSCSVCSLRRMFVMHVIVRYKAYQRQCIRNYCSCLAIYFISTNKVICSCYSQTCLHHTLIRTKCYESKQLQICIMHNENKLFVVILKIFDTNDISIHIKFIKKRNGPFLIRITHYIILYSIIYAFSSK